MRCNYVSTLQGVVLGHNLRNYFKHRWGNGFGNIFAAALWFDEVALNFVDDFYGLMIAL